MRLHKESDFGSAHKEKFKTTRFTQRKESVFKLKRKNNVTFNVIMIGID